MSNQNNHHHGHRRRGRTFHYKGMRVNSFGLPVFDSDSPKVIRNQKYTDRAPSLFSFRSPFLEDLPKDTILTYDIPSGQKRERDWFRRHLVKFGFVMVQKSVWIGPSPFPKYFLRYLKEIKIGDSFKTFKLAEPYSLKN